MRESRLASSRLEVAIRRLGASHAGAERSSTRRSRPLTYVRFSPRSRRTTASSHAFSRSSPRRRPTHQARGWKNQAICSRLANARTIGSSRRMWMSSWRSTGSSSSRRQASVSDKGRMMHGRKQPWIAGPRMTSSRTTRTSTGHRMPSSERSWSILRSTSAGSGSTAAAKRRRHRADRTAWRVRRPRTPIHHAMNSKPPNDVVALGGVARMGAPDRVVGPATTALDPESSELSLAGMRFTAFHPPPGATRRRAAARRKLATLPQGDVNPAGIASRSRTTSHMTWRTRGGNDRRTKRAAATIATSTVNWVLTSSTAASHCRTSSSLMTPPPPQLPVAAGRRRPPRGSGRRAPRGGDTEE